MVQTVDNTQAAIEVTNENTPSLPKPGAGWQSLPKGQPLPDTPEIRSAILDLYIKMYGDALKELEKN